MKDTSISGGVSHALCRVCAIARKRGNAPAVDHVRAALEAAEEEIGLSHIPSCPADDVDDCPLIRRRVG